MDKFPNWYDYTMTGILLVAGLFWLILGLYSPNVYGILGGLLLTGSATFLFRFMAKEKKRGQRYFSGESKE